jgi:hypothetical protein
MRNASGRGNSQRAGRISVAHCAIHASPPLSPPETLRPPHAWSGAVWPSIEATSPAPPAPANSARSPARICSVSTRVERSALRRRAETRARSSARGAARIPLDWDRDESPIPSTGWRAGAFWVMPLAVRARSILLRVHLLALASTQVKSAVRITCRMTAGHRKTPLKWPERPT